MTGPGAAIFDFADLGSGERWRLRFNEGRFPWWLFDRSRRAPGTAFREYLAPLPMILARAWVRDGRRSDDAAQGRSMSACGVRSCSPGSTRSRRKGRPRSRPVSCARPSAPADTPAIRSSRPTACRRASSIRRWPSSPRAAARRASASGCRPFASRGGARSPSMFDGAAQPLGDDDSVVLATPPCGGSGSAFPASSRRMNFGRSSTGISASRRRRASRRFSASSTG